MTLRSALLRPWWMGPFYPFLNEILIIYNLYLEDICKSSQVSNKDSTASLVEVKE